MTRDVFVIVSVLLLLFAPARGQESNGLRPVDYLGEAGGSVGCGVAVGAGTAIALGLVGAGLAPSGYRWDGFSIGAVLGVGLGYPAGCGWGATLVGYALFVDGHTAGAYVGAFAGMGLGLLAFSVDPRVGLVAMGVLAPAGSVIGYILGATRGDQGPDFGGRVLPPALAFSMRPSSDRQTHAVVKCRLVTVRF
ncbi:MAG TPA: hypothetical protein VMH22_10495 [bacterium]|nr:hypothetical protein [bacterium]